MIPCLLFQFYAFEFFDEVDVAGGLFAEAVDEVGVFEAAGVVEEAIDAGHEDAFGVDEAVAVAEDLLELFDGAEGAPHAFGDADEADGTPFEAGGEFEHVDEVFEDAGDAAVVFGGHDDEAVGFGDSSLEGREAGGGFLVGTGVEDFGREIFEVDGAEFDAEFAVDFFDVFGDGAGAAAGTVGSDDHCDHGREDARRGIRKQSSRLGASHFAFDGFV